MKALPPFKPQIYAKKEFDVAIFFNIITQNTDLVHIYSQHSNHSVNAFKKVSDTYSDTYESFEGDNEIGRASCRERV